MHSTTEETTSILTTIVPSAFNPSTLDTFTTSFGQSSKGITIMTTYLPTTLLSSAITSTEKKSTALPTHRPTTFNPSTYNPSIESFTSRDATSPNLVVSTLKGITTFPFDYLTIKVTSFPNFGRSSEEVIETLISTYLPTSVLSITEHREMPISFNPPSVSLTSAENTSPGFVKSTTKKEVTITFSINFPFSYIHTTRNEETTATSFIPSNHHPSSLETHTTKEITRLESTLSSQN